MSEDRLTCPRQPDDLLLYRLHRLNVTARPLVVRMCERDYGITRREWRVLACLAQVEGVRSSALAERALLDRARTSRALSSLVAKGLARREPRPANRREVRVFLTDAGRRLYAEMFPRVAAVQRDLLASFSAEERAVLDELLARLQARAQTLANAS